MTKIFKLIASLIFSINLTCQAGPPAHFRQTPDLPRISLGCDKLLLALFDDVANTCPSCGTPFSRKPRGGSPLVKCVACDLNVLGVTRSDNPKQTIGVIIDGALATLDPLPHPAITGPEYLFFDQIASDSAGTTLEPRQRTEPVHFHPISRVPTDEQTGPAFDFVTGQPINGDVFILTGLSRDVRALRMIIGMIANPSARIAWVDASPGSGLSDQSVITITSSLESLPNLELLRVLGNKDQQLSWNLAREAQAYKKP